MIVRPSTHSVTAAPLIGDDPAQTRKAPDMTTALHDQLTEAAALPLRSDEATDRSYEAGHANGRAMLARLLLDEADVEGQVRISGRVQAQLDRVLNAQERTAPYARGYLHGRREVVELLRAAGVLDPSPV